MTAEIIKKWKCFGGMQYVFRHHSKITGTEMQFAAFVPAHKDGDKFPSLVFLSGLTCTWENFTTKAGAQQFAAREGVIMVMPDTSPRGELVLDDAAYNLGQGAGFYVDATEAPWNKNFKMYSYINDELFNLLPEILPIDKERCGISGHSMGGHGALLSAFRNPQKYRSVSAFSPICAPMQCPWGETAFKAYLGEDKNAWENYDASSLARRTKFSGPVLIDIGSSDEFLDIQLKPELLQNACAENSIDVHIQMHDGYDHSYYFISSFIEKHIIFHARFLKASV